MKLERARIRNFRCIDDSEDFTVDELVTCLVGKNESGKTALLTALYRLNPMFDDGEFDRQKDYPRRYLADYEDRHAGVNPVVVMTWWTLEEHEARHVADKLGSVLRTDEVLVWKGYSNQVCWHVECDEAAMVEHFIDTSGLNDDEKLQLGALTTLAELEAKIAALPETSPGRTALRARIDSHAPGGDVQLAVTKLLELPKFLLFSQYHRMQGTVSLEQLQERKAKNTLAADDQVFLALCELASVTIEQAVSIQSFESIVTRFEGASSKVSAEIFRYWSQNKALKVQFRLDRAEPDDPPPFNSGRIFRTRIYNDLHDVTVPFDERSAGFVWFFSFLTMFAQLRKHHHGRMVVLLDEPGLSLHGRAQADLVQYFNERVAPEHQVIFTTHSPFMIPAENLSSVRTVEDVVVYLDGERPDVRGTKVGGEALSTDRDTLLPLQAALGYEITQSLFVGKHALLVDGPADVLYLAAFSDELRGRKRTHLDRRWTICPCGGFEKVGVFMSLFGGSRLRVAALTDASNGQYPKLADLNGSEILREGRVLSLDTYAGQREADIEDVLGATLYAELVNACYGLKAKRAVSGPASLGSRIVKHVEDHFLSLTKSAPEFDHYAPASYLTEHRSTVLKRIPGQELDAVLSRFERLFCDLNALLV